MSTYKYFIKRKKKTLYSNSPNARIFLILKTIPSHPWHSSVTLFTTGSGYTIIITTIKITHITIKIKIYNKSLNILLKIDKEQKLHLLLFSLFL